MFPKSQHVPLADDTALAKTRHTIGTILKRQNDDYEQAMKEFVKNESDDERSKELLQQKKLKNLISGGYTRNRKSL